MSRFEILQIGEDVEPTAGIPEGCEICGHCRMLRHTLPDGAPLPCGGTAGRERRPPSVRSSEQRIQGAN
jgi:hypothetical protein